MDEPVRKRRMPQRTQPHIVEDKSWFEFGSSIPEGWVVRDQRGNDYGIDGEVEIFREGFSTGFLYKVQIKGTAEADCGNLRVNISDYADYYSAIALPVMIVLHCQEAGRLYGRWFHSHNPDGMARDKPKSLGFTEDDLLVGAGDRIAGDVQAFYQLRVSRSALPLLLQLERPGTSIAGVSTAYLGLMIRAAIEAVDVPLGLVTEETGEGIGVLRLHNDRIEIDLRGVASFNVGLESQPDGDGITEEEVVATALVGTGVLLDRLGFSDAALPIFERFAEASPLSRRQDVMRRILACFVRSRRVPEAIRLADVLVDQADSAETTDLIAAFGLLLGPLRKRDRDAVREFATKRSNQFETNGDIEGAAKAAWALGAVLSWSEPESAVRYLDRALRLAPEFEREAGMWLDRGAGLFSAGRFTEAAVAYEKAIELGAGGRTPFALADSQMMAGLYSKARTGFSRAIEDNLELATSEAMLKVAALAFIFEMAGGDQSARRPCHARCQGEMRSEGQLLEHLRDNALCGLAWFNLGHIAAAQRNPVLAMERFLVCGICQPWDGEAWAQALVCAFAGGMNEDIAIHISHASRYAYVSNGAGFLSEVERVTRLSGLEPAEQERIFEILEISATTPDSPTLLEETD